MKQGYIHVYQTPEIAEIFNSTEGMTGAKLLGDYETPPAGNLETGFNVTVTENRFGEGIVVPESKYKRAQGDSTIKVREFLKRERDQLLLTNLQLFCTESHKLLNESFDNTSSYLAPDSVEICGSHTWQSGGTFDNAITSIFDGEDVADEIDEYAGAYTDPAGKETPLNFTHFVVKKGSAASRWARKVYAKDISPTAIGDVNLYPGSLTVVETPYITTANKTKWWVMDLSVMTSPLAVGMGLYPQLNDPIVENNEAIRTNCTGFWKEACINMPWQVLGSDGTV